MLLLRQLSCRRAAPLLARWCEAPSGLSAEERARVASHIARCSACRDQVETMRRMADLLRRDRPAAASPAPDLWARLQARIEHEPQDSAPLLPEIPALEPLAAPQAGWARTLGRAVPVGVAATVGLFVLTFRADFGTPGGVAPRIDGSAVVVPALPPPGPLTGEDDPGALPVPMDPGAPVRMARAPKPPRASSSAASSPGTLASVRRQAAEAMRRDARVAAGARPVVGRDNPFEPLRRPASPPVLTAPVVVAGAAPGPSAPAPAPLRGRPVTAPVTAAPVASAPSPRAAGSPAAAMEPPTARPPQPVAMASRATATEPVVAVSPEPDADAERREPLPGDSVALTAVPRVAARRPVEVALLPTSVRDPDASQSAQSAADAVSALRRQRSLFNYGGAGAAGEQGGAGRQP